MGFAEGEIAASDGDASAQSAVIDVLMRNVATLRQRQVGGGVKGRGWV